MSSRLSRVFCCASLGALTLYATTANAEINLVTPDADSDSAWDKFEVQFGAVSVPSI